MLLNKKGVSMLYVLMALVCVGAMGSLVLSMAKKEKADSSLRYSSELARYGATGGLVLAVNEPLRTKEFEDLMQKWYKVYYGQTKETMSPNDKWLKLGEGYDYSNGKYYEDEKNNKMKLRARVVNVDFSGLQQNPPVINIMIECESIDKSGSRAKNVAFYKIYGFEEERKENIPNSALYLGGGADEIDVPLTVKGVNDNTRGNTFLRGSGKIKHSGHIFGTEAMKPNGGEFRLRGTYTDKTGENDIGNIQGSTFYGPAYFGADKSVTDGSTNNSAPFLYVRKLFGSTPSKFFGKFGLESSIFFEGQGQKVQFHDDIYLNGAIRNAAGNTGDNAGWILNKKLGKTGNTADDYPKIYYSNNAIYNINKTDLASNSSGWTDNSSVKKEEGSTENDITKMYITPTGVTITAENTSLNTNTILEKLNMIEEPASIRIKLDEIPGGFPTTLTTVNGKTPGMGTGITGADLNIEYETQKAAGKLVKDGGTGSSDGWMLLRLGNNPNATIFADPSSGADGANVAFTGKMVLLIDGETPYNSVTNEYGSKGSNINLFVSGQNSNSLIIVDHKRSAAQLGHNNLIRGLIVKRGDGQLIFKSTGTNMVLRGAAYCVKDEYTTSNPSFRLEGGADNRITIEYDPSALTEIRRELKDVVCIEEDGKPCDDSDSDSKLKEIIDFSKISAKQVSRLF